MAGCCSTAPKAPGLSTPPSGSSTPTAASPNSPATARAAPRCCWPAKAKPNRVPHPHRRGHQRPAPHIRDGDREFQFEMNMGSIRGRGTPREGAGPRRRDRRRGQSAMRCSRWTISISTGAPSARPSSAIRAFPNRTNVSFHPRGGSPHHRCALLGARRGRNQQLRHRFHRRRRWRRWRADSPKAR